MTTPDPTTPSSEEWDSALWRRIHDVLLGIDWGDVADIEDVTGQVYGAVICQPVTPHDCLASAQAEIERAAANRDLSGDQGRCSGRSGYAEDYAHARGLHDAARILRRHIEAAR